MCVCVTGCEVGHLRTYGYSPYHFSNEGDSDYFGLKGERGGGEEGGGDEGWG